MVFKGCKRCNGDMRVEEDMTSRSEDLVCLQCGHRQAVQATMNVDDYIEKVRSHRTQLRSTVAA
jgi:hypothetical protein